MQCLTDLVLGVHDIPAHYYPVISSAVCSILFHLIPILEEALMDQIALSCLHASLVLLSSLF